MLSQATSFTGTPQHAESSVSARSMGDWFAPISHIAIHSESDGLRMPWLILQRES